VIGAVVIGTGFGCYTHVRALRAAGFDVLALVGRDPDKTAERARLFDVPNVCSSLTDALRLSGVDAVTIATPPRTHGAFALEALAAGRHVLCEKPFTADLGEARVVLSAAEAAGVVHLLGTEFRFDGGQATLARAVADGRIGVPKLATWLMHVPVLTAPDAVVPDWWADAGARGGWLWAHGSQLIDQIRVTVGEVAGVSASLLHVIDRPAMSADDGFVVHLRFRSGAAGVMQSTAGDHGILVETRVTGSTGAAWIEGVGQRVKVADAGGVHDVPVAAGLTDLPAPPLPAGAVTTTYEQMITFGVEYAPYVRLAQCFHDRIVAAGGGGRGSTAGPEGQDPGERAGWPAPATFADGVAQMAVLEAIMTSDAAGGAWTEVAAVG